MASGGIEAPDIDDDPTTSGRQDAPFTFVLENCSLETAHVGKVSIHLPFLSKVDFSIAARCAMQDGVVLSVIMHRKAGMSA